MVCATSLLTIGDPVTDVVIEVTDEELAQFTNEPGGCAAITGDELGELLGRLKSLGVKSINMPGGSAANVATCMANLLPTCACQFSGAIGDDLVGTLYEEHLRSRHVKTLLARPAPASPSAVSLCLISPCGQRTMRTCLGAALHYTDEHLPRGAIRSATILHCEGYALYKPKVLRAAIREARAAGAEVSLDLASFEVMRQCSGTLKELLNEGSIDVIFCNEDEAAELARLRMPDRCSVTDEERELIHDLLGQCCKIAVLTLGAKGARVISKDLGSLRVPACRVDVVDTVGAGDYFCGAFLAAYSQGCSMQACAAAGCAAGAQVAQCRGAQLGPDDWASLQEMFRVIVTRPD